jgi:hypothetical protein
MKQAFQDHAIRHRSDEGAQSALAEDAYAEVPQLLREHWRTDIVRVRGSTPLSVPAQCNACGLKATLWDRVQLWTDYRR